MPSFKHIFMAMACLASHHFGLTTALPAYPTSVSVSPSELPFGAPYPPTAFTAAPSGTSFPAADPDHKHGAPDFAPGARNQTNGIFAAEYGGANNTDHCHDMPGNHTRHGDEHERHLNQTGTPEDDHRHQHNDTRPSGTPTNSFVALITPPPDTTAVDAAKGAKFVQTTYYSCVTIGPDSHCGWHEPILDASMDSAGYKINSNAWLYGSAVVAAMVLM